MNVTRIYFTVSPTVTLDVEIPEGLSAWDVANELKCSDKFWDELGDGLMKMAFDWTDDVDVELDSEVEGLDLTADQVYGFVDKWKSPDEFR